MNALRKLASHTALYGVTYIVGRFLNVLLTPFYTYYFGNPADYGALTLIFSYIGFFNILYTYGMETGYFFFANRDENRNVEGPSFLSLLYSSLLLSGTMIVFSPWLAELANFAERPEYIVYTALILLFDTLMVIPFAMLRKQERAKRFAVLKLLSIVLNIAFNLFFLVAVPWSLMQPELSFIHPLFEGLDVKGNEVSYILISNLLASGLTLLFLLPEIRSIKLKWDGELWRKMLSYSWPLLIIGFAGMVNEFIDRIMLDRRLMEPPLDLTQEEARQQLGIYGACYKFSVFMTIAIQAFRFAAEPFFFAHLKDEGGKQAYAQILKYFSFATGLIFLGIMMYLGVIRYFVANEYWGALGLVPVLLIANMFLGFYVYLSQWYKQTGKTLYGAFISLGGALVTIAINYYLIPIYGYYASAWATFGVYFGMAVFSFLLGRRFFPVEYPIGRIVFYILSAVALYGLSYAFLNFVAGEWNVLTYAFNTLILIVYLAFFAWLERDMTGSIFSFVKRKIS